ncbi:hypothetical protein MKW94_024956 [Papaver nudicaule]|uniref:At3g05675-like ankyrin-like domain-containing protein n=1 Tax=Papaver nudicaule TaxID=74823 RepID=A0AA42B0I3_PAPNU|nr:hypothetical protein [Papaver nudicaule]
MDRYSVIPFSSCVHLLHTASIHPYPQTIRKPQPLLPSPTYVHAANVTISSLISTSCSLIRNPLIKPYRIKHNPFTSCSTSSSKSVICMAAPSSENATSGKIAWPGNTPKIPATEICILVVVYIIPFLNRLNLLSKFPVWKYAMNPIMPLFGFYQSIPTLGLIALLALFIVSVRYRNARRFNYTLQAMVMDCVVGIASLFRPFLVNSVPLAGGALGFKSQLLNVLELLGFQTCIHSCLEYLGAVEWVEKDEKVDESSDPSISTLAHIMEVVLKTNGDEGRREGKLSVLKLLRESTGLFSDVNSAETLNMYLLSLCRSCLKSLLDLFKKAPACKTGYVGVQIALEIDNLLWLLDILEDRQATEEFALIWAKQQELAKLHTKITYLEFPHRLVSCLTSRLIVGIGKKRTLAAEDARKLLLQTWFQPLVDDYFYLKKRRDFDPKVVEENIGRIILELPLNDQESIMLPWFECFMKNGGHCPDLRQAFDGWSRRSIGKTRLF